ncbi:MAG: DsbA family protein [Thermomicrobiales bacterium]
MSDAHTGTDLAEPVTEQDHSRGPATAPVTLVQYGDSQCPDTKRAHGVVQTLRARFGDDLRVVFRHFPRIAKHPHAERAAHLAEAAADKGRFWEMHDSLLSHEGEIDQEALEAYADRFGLDPGHYEAGHRYATRVSDDLQSGLQSGVDGTPTFYINGRRHAGANDLDTLQAAIEAAR